jgi:hypothetical protein
LPFRRPEAAFKYVIYYICLTNQLK